MNTQYNIMSISVGGYAWLERQKESSDSIWLMIRYYYFVRLILQFIACYFMYSALIKVLYWEGK